MTRNFDPAQIRIMQSGMDKEDLLGQNHTIEPPSLLL